MKKILSFKKEILISVLLLIGYLTLRIYHLTLIPIFTDEAIYIRWAEIARYDANWRFISLTDGKQPLFVWLVMIAVRFFSDPLFAGRLVSVLSGLGTMLGLFFLTRELFQKKQLAFLAAILYLFYPFALVYDRMALMDSMVGMFAVWALFLEILLVRYLRLDIALVLGMVIGGGILTKSSGFFNIYLLPFSLLLFSWKDKQRFKRLFFWFGLAFLAVIESQIIYLVLRLSPFYNMIAEKNSVFIYSLNEWSTHPWRFFWGNLRGLMDWLKGYFGWPMLIPIVLSPLFFKNFFREKLLLLAWFGLPFVGLALFGRVLYPRFIFFMTLPLLLLIVSSWEKFNDLIKKRYLIMIFSGLLFFNWLRVDWQFLNDPYQADIPKSDKTQYLNDWPAGGGINEIVVFFNQESSKNKIYVATEGTFGPLPYALEVYLYKNNQVEIHGFWPLKEKIPEEVLASAEKKPTYFVFNQTQLVPVNKDWPLKFVAKYRKGSGDAYLQLYQVLSEN